MTFLLIFLLSASCSDFRFFNSRLIAVGPSADRGGPIWSTPVESRLAPQALDDLSRLSQGVVHTAGPRRLEAFDARDGAPLWSWTPPQDHLVDSIEATDGVLLLKVRRRIDATSETLVALEEVSGVELWRRVMMPGTVPICGDGHLALMEERTEKAQVIDLFLGGEIGTLEVGPRTLAGLDKAWIHDGRLGVVGQAGPPPPPPKAPPPTPSPLRPMRTPPAFGAARPGT